MPHGWGGGVGSGGTSWWLRCDEGLEWLRQGDGSVEK